MNENIECIECEQFLRWHDALTDNPKDVREYIVFVGSTNTYGEKYGFISFAKWCGHGWDRFGLLDQEAIPHVVEWIEWMPTIPDGYKQED